MPHRLRCPPAGADFANLPHSTSANSEARNPIGLRVASGRKANPPRKPDAGGRKSCWPGAACAASGSAISGTHTPRPCLQWRSCEDRQCAARPFSVGLTLDLYSLAARSMQVDAAALVDAALQAAIRKRAGRHWVVKA